MFDKAVLAVERFGMLRSRDTVVAAVSGGADSMAMLCFLLNVREIYNLNIIAAHVNHGLRGDEAARDENFVRDFCACREIPFEVLHADVAAEAEKSGESTEECGRRIRYEFFSRICSGAKIATAHTANDNAETVLFNLTRGAALKGICGIPPVRGNIIRPLIYCTRAEIENYCAENGISFVTDSTNLTLDYTRNKIRHTVVPALSEINPSFADSVSRLSESARLDEDYLSGTVRRLIKSAASAEGYRAAAFLGAHKALGNRAVHMLLEQECPEQANSRMVFMISDILKRGGKIQLSDELFAVCSCGILRFERTFSPTEEWGDDIDSFESGEVQCDGGRINLHCVNKKVFLDTQKIHKDILDYCVDYDKIVGKAHIGSRREGDKITLAKRRCTKTLKKLFNEAHIEPEKRNGIAVLSDISGVLWVEGFGADMRAKVTGDTKNFLIINVGGKFNE